MNELICAHSFCLLTALQIKSIRSFDYLTRWLDQCHPDDPSTRGAFTTTTKTQKKLQTFIDRLAEKNRARRAKHKGGVVPLKRKKIEVEYYPSDGEEDDPDNPLQLDATSADLSGKKTAKVYDLMVPAK